MKRTDFLKTMGLTAMGIGIGIPGLTHGMSGITHESSGDPHGMSGDPHRMSGDPHGMFHSTGINLPDLLVDTKGKPIQSLKKWNKERAVIKKRWLEYMGALAPNPKAPVLKVLSEEKHKGIIRQYVEYEGEPGITVHGYLLKPENLHHALPGVVALHSTSDNQMLCISGAEKGRFVQFGFELAQQGFVVFCPQCFLWHQNQGRNWEEQSMHYIKDHPGTRGMGKMLFDAQRAVDVLESLEEVDSSRIGCMGHSLGAKEAFYLGAFDDRVKTTVSNEGGIGIEMSNWDAIWYLGEEIGAFGHQHHEVLALAAPSPFLLIGGDSADGEHSRPYIEAVKPVYDLYGMKDKLELRNHGLGHHAEAIAVEWTYDWIKKHL
jgi:dienelactone hydrolase